MKYSTFDYILKLERKSLIIYLFFISIVLFHHKSEAAALTYHGRILNSDNTPVTASIVQFKIQIRSPGSENCLLYEEVQNKDLSTTSGTFVLGINDGSGMRTDSSGIQFNQVFSNAKPLTFSSGACGSGTTYTPTANDSRLLQIYFNDGSGQEQLPVQAINYTPKAIDALQISGFDINSLVRVANGTNVQSVSPLSSANYAELMALINGSTTQYMKSTTTGTNLPVLTSSPASPAAGQVWYDGTTNQVKYYNGSTVQTVGSAGAGITSLTVGTALTAGGVSGGTLSAAGTIDLANTGVTGGTYTKLTVDAKGRVTSASNLTESDLPHLTTAGKVSGSAITSGTIGGSTTVSTSGRIETSSSMRLFDGGPTNYVGLQAPASVTTSYNLTLPNAVPSVAGSLLTSNTSGGLSWTTPSSLSPWVPAGSDIYFTSGNVGIGTSTPTEKLDISGNINFSGIGNAVIHRGNDSSPLDLYGGPTYSQGSKLSLYGENEATNPGRAVIAYGGATVGSLAQTNAYFQVFRRNSAGTQSVLLADMQGRVGIGTTSPTVSLDLGSKTDAVRLPAGTTAQQPVSPAAGMMRWNSDNTAMEFYNGISWVDVAASGASSFSNVNTITGGTSGLAISAGGTNQNVSLTASGTGTVTTGSPVTITNSMASTAWNNGALVVSGGVGLSGSLNAAGNITSSASMSAATSMYSPIIYGSSTSAGNVTLDSTSHATKGNIILAPSGGNVGVGTSSPVTYGRLTVTGNNNSIQLGAASASGGYFDLSSNGLAGGFLWTNHYYSVSDKSTVAGYSPLIQLGMNDGAIKFSTSGANAADASLTMSERLRITDAGNVGIGTSNPQTRLDVNAPDASGITVRNTSESSNTIQLFNAGGGTASRRAVIQGWRDTVGALPLTLQESGGNVGIGTTGANSKLTINGLQSGIVDFGMFTMHDESYPADVVTGRPGLTFGYDNANDWSWVYSRRQAKSGQPIYINGTMLVQPFNNRVGIGTTIPSSLLTVDNNTGSATIATNILKLQNSYLSDGSGIYGIQLAGIDNGTDGHNLQIQGRATPSGGFAALMTVRNSGQVGIGTTNPSVSLDLGSKTDAVRLPAGTTAQQPASPAAGMIRWNSDNTAAEIYNGTGWVSLGTYSGAGTYSNVNVISGGSSGLSISAGGTNQNLTLSSSGTGTVTTGSPVTITNATASTASNNGALVVTGGVGVSGALNTGGNIYSGASISAATSMYSPIIYGGTASSVNLTLDSTVHATKGNVLISPSGGNVGIGTASPQMKLDIAGNGNGSVGIGQISDDPFVWFDRSDGGTQRLGWRIREDANRGLNFETGTNTTKYNQTFTNAVRIDATGNVGIGTTSPSVYSNITNLYTAGTNGGAIILGEPAGTFKGVVLGDFNNQRMDIGSSTNHPVRVIANNTEAIRVIPNGNVGIGTTTPTAKLTVNGNSSLGVVSQGSSSTERFYPNVISSAVNSTVTGAWVVHTPILRTSSVMFKLRVHGYAYNHAKSIDFYIVGYAYSGGTGNVDGAPGQIINYSIEDLGNDGLAKYVGIDANGKLAVAMGSTSLSAYFYRISVDAWLSSATDFSSGWSIDQNTTAGFGWLDIYGPLTTTIANALSVNSSSMVGIGTTSPNSGLQVSSSAGSWTTSNWPKNLQVGNDGAAGLIRFPLNSSSQPAIGSTTDGKLRFMHSSANDASGTASFDMTIDTNGNVGIGTINPSQLLDVAKSVSGAVGPIAQLTNPATSAAGNAVELRFAPTASYTSRYSSIQGINTDGSNNIDLAFITGAGATITEKMRISSAGNVGIGTNSPAAKLDVSGSGSAAAIKAYSNSGVPSLLLASSSGNPYMQFNSGGFIQDLGSGSIRTRASGASSYLIFDTNSIERMRIDNVGNVGIGTPSPATRLDLQSTSYVQERLWNTNGSQQFWQGSVADTVGSYIGNNAYYSSSFQFMPNYTAASGINFRQDGSTEFWNDTGLTSGTVYVPTKRMTILNNGNVGIGTVSPSANLEVKTATIDTSTTAFRLTSSDGSFVPGQELQMDFNQDSNSISRIAMTYFNPDWGLNFYGFNGSLNSTPIVTMRGSGNVGVGTMSPVARLESKLAGDQGDILKLSSSDAEMFNFRSDRNDNHRVPIFKLSGFNDISGTRGVGGIIHAETANAATQASDAVMQFNVTQSGGSVANANLFNWSNNDVQVMTINQAGNVGIGTTSPTEKLEVNGNVKATAFLYTSDINLKKEILPIQNSLSKIVNLDAITFRYKTDSSNSTSSSNRHMGLIAQQVKDAFPETVVKNKEGFLSVDYPALVAPLVAAIKELYLNWFDDHKLIQIQLSEIEKLKMENEELKKRMNRIEQQLNQRSPAQAQ